MRLLRLIDPAFLLAMLSRFAWILRALLPGG